MADTVDEQTLVEDAAVPDDDAVAATGPAAAAAAAGQDDLQEELSPCWPTLELERRRLL